MAVFLPRLVVATGNRGKLRELESLLAGFAGEIVPQSRLGIPSPPETETTFRGNALLKARHAAALAGLPALADAVTTLMKRRDLAQNPLHGQVAAVSVGIVGGTPVLDLDYAEDSEAETDMNVVMNGGGGFIEVQGTAEGHAFRRHELDELLNLAAGGIGQLIALQRQALDAGH